MSRTVEINFCRVLSIGLTYTPANPPAPANWNVTATYTVGYVDHAGTLTDYAGLTQRGTVTIPVRDSDGPAVDAPVLFTQILAQEGLSQADGDRLYDHQSNRLA